MSKKKRIQTDRESLDKRPNFLILMVDQQRFQAVYENEELEKWRINNLRTQELLKKNGFEFLNHYAGSTACSPSRATIYTGQYPSLHGVTQTTGAAKSGFDPDVFWLDPNSVPTMGDYFSAAGYRTYWKGKWHLSDEDILIPGTHNALTTYDPITGVPNKEKEVLYLNANRLAQYGFSGWVGPEPHGADPHNSGSSSASAVNGRDVVYSSEAVQLIKALDQEPRNTKQKPWLIVSSFVNPHDISLYGQLTQHSRSYDFRVDPSVPYISPAPTANESLHTKPIAQENYRKVYQKALQPTRDTLFFRQLYFSLHKQVDDEMLKVYRALQESSFQDDTIVIFLSDHGEMLGAHGGLFQKWYNTYEESIHIPFIIHSPKLFSGRESTKMLTSHVDILPTMLGLAGIDVQKIQKKLRKNFSEVHPLAGRNLVPLMEGNHHFPRANEALYFMTDDDVFSGQNQVNSMGVPYESVVQPNHIESVITTLEIGKNPKQDIWKFSRYFDNPKFWSDPGKQDQESFIEKEYPIHENSTLSVNVNTTKTKPVPDQFELYNLSMDPLEENNLADPSNASEESRIIQKTMMKILEEQSRQKRLYPSKGDLT